MLTPSFLPPDLIQYGDPSIDTETALFDKLVANPQDFLRFFEAACDDEMWVSNHEEYVSKAIAWLTKQSFQDKLTENFCERAASAIRKNYQFLGRFVPKNLTIRLKEFESNVNTLLLSTISESFKEGVLRCRERNLPFYDLDQWSLREFSAIDDFACNGVISDLWKWGEADLFNLLALATAFEIPGVIADCQAMLRKYVTTQNVITILATAQHKRWEIIKARCIEMINGFDWGFELSAPHVEMLRVKFHSFSSLTLEHFSLIAKLTTEVACSGNWVDAPAFSHVMKECPLLQSVDLSRTPSWSDYFTDIPARVRVLNLTECPWLSTRELRLLSEACPNLEEFNLSNNTQLDLECWGELLKFKTLKSLNIGRCFQMKDDDLKIIVQACVGLTSLNLTECRHLTDAAFFDLSGSLPALMKLNITRTLITDAALVDIGARCSNLQSVNISRCEVLTEKGVLALVKHTPSLRELIAGQMPFVDSLQGAINQLNPKLTIKTE